MTNDSQPQAPHDPALGLPVDVLEQLVQADWHAAHPDVEHPTEWVESTSSRDITRDGTNTYAYHRCGCRTPSAQGEFAVRLLTGQAPMSMTPDGIGINLRAVRAGQLREVAQGMAAEMMQELLESQQLQHVAAAHLNAAGQDDPLGETLASLVVHGHVEQVPCTTCERPEPHTQVSINVVGATIGGSREELDADDALHLLDDALRDLLAEHRCNDALRRPDGTRIDGTTPETGA